MKELKLIGLIITGIGAALTASMLAILLYEAAQLSPSVPIVPGLLFYLGIAILVVGVIISVVWVLGSLRNNKNRPIAGQPHRTS